MGGLLLLGVETLERGGGKWKLFHDGSVDDGLDVVLSVSRVDDPLPFGVLFDVALCEQLKAHVRRHRLETKHNRAELTGRNSRCFMSRLCHRRFQAHHARLHPFGQILI